jgi:hypothetical protein
MLWPTELSCGLESILTIVTLIQRLAEDVFFMKGATSDITPLVTAFQPDANALRSVQDFIQRHWFSRLWITRDSPRKSINDTKM